MGLIWFSLGLGGEILRTWKGNTISDPLPLISSEKVGVSEIDVMLELSKIYVSITCLIMSSTAERLSFWEHYTLVG